MQKDAGGRQLVNGRYMLNECLFASELGTLYLASDTRSDANTAIHSDTLIHFLPHRLLTYSELPDVFRRLQQRVEPLDCPVLSVLDYGWSGTVAFIIMALPESWSVNVLPPCTASPATCISRPCVPPLSCGRRE
ncbi:MAG: hypothetical protein R3E95_08695 [Thiolinea sp.]